MSAVKGFIAKIEQFDADRRRGRLSPEAPRQGSALVRE